MNQPSFKDGLRVITVSSLGGCFEMFDFVIYIFFAPVLATLFFPNKDKFISLLSIFAVFAVGYLARPLGALIFGFYGDRYGRKTALLTTIILMTLATLAIGLLPTFEQIGVAAPVLLIILRFLQGIAVGGDLPGGITFVAEYAPADKRCYHVSWVFLGVNVGIVLASSIGALINGLLVPADVYAWGWRLGFASSLILMFIGFYFRAKLAETPVFAKFLQQVELVKNPLNEVFSKRYFFTLIKGIGICWLFAVIISQIFLYTPTFLHSIMDTSLRQSLLINTASVIVFSAFIPVMGMLADRIGRKKVLLWSSFGFLFLSYVLYAIIVNESILGVFLALLVFDLLSAAVVGVVPCMLAELFPTDYRYSGVAVSYGVGFALFSGLTPLIITFLIHHFDNNIAISYNLILGAVITIIAALFIKASDRTVLKSELSDEN